MISDLDPAWLAGSKKPKVANVLAVNEQTLDTAWVRVELVAMLLAWQPVTVGEAIIFSASPPHTLASIGPAAHNFAPYAFHASFIRCDEHRAHQRVSPSRFSPSPSHKYHCIRR